jgi:hypothetical protein
VIEAGLGKGHEDFRRIRLHTLPGPRPASELWPRNGTTHNTTGSRDAYQKLLKEGLLDQCGVTTLAGKAVGAPFVGAVAACLVVSEVLRVLHDGASHDVIEMDLESPDYRSAIVSAQSRPPNIGFIPI